MCTSAPVFTPRLCFAPDWTFFDHDSYRIHSIKPALGSSLQCVVVNSVAILLHRTVMRISLYLLRGSLSVLCHQCTANNDSHCTCRLIFFIARHFLSQYSCWIGRRVRGRNWELYVLSHFFFQRVYCKWLKMLIIGALMWRKRKVFTLLSGKHPSERHPWMGAKGGIFSVLSGWEGWQTCSLALSHQSQWHKALWLWLSVNSCSLGDFSFSENARVLDPVL